MYDEFSVIEDKEGHCKTCGEKLFKCEIHFGRCCACGETWETNVVPIDINKNIDYQKMILEIKQVMEPGRFRMRKQLLYIKGIIARHENKNKT